MDEYIKKHLNDMLNSMNEVESYFNSEPKIFEKFNNDILRQRAVERENLLVE
ncbi:hypothetical protein EZS27_006576 [termite gut metagenome]|jgi:uncharacterized protein with HEPN domain|uniref:Uncharacterized protein n=1 Tax=termite gut metagenome TaxID=433724 RepID=A0A5J4SI47_9ZZZZ